MPGGKRKEGVLGQGNACPPTTKTYERGVRGQKSVSAEINVRGEEKEERKENSLHACQRHRQAP